MIRALWLILLANLLSLPALAQGVHVCVLGVQGKGAGAPVTQGLQDALAKLPGVTFETARNFLAEASQRGVDDRVESGGRPMAQVARALSIDAVVRGTLEESRRSKDKVLTLSVYNGGDGKLLGEQVLTVSGGKFTPAFFKQAARAVEPYIHMGTSRGDPGVMVDPAPRRPEGRRPGGDDEVKEVADGTGETAEPATLDTHDEPAPTRSDDPKAEAVVVRAGLAFVKRTFRCKVAVPTAATIDHYLFVPDGISYNSSLSPGVAFQGDIYPLAFALTGPVTGIGLSLGYEKTFLGTQQKVNEVDGTSQTAHLDTKQSVFDLGLKYRYTFSPGPGGVSPEVDGGLGMAWSTFDLGKNDVYRGTDYRYLHLGVGGRVPLGTPYAIAELALRFIPSADLGSTAKELGKTVDAMGYGLTVGMSSELGSGFTAGVSLDYTSFSGDVKGEGRANAAGQVREGSSMEDAYLGILIEGGYHF